MIFVVDVLLRTLPFSSLNWIRSSFASSSAPGLEMCGSDGADIDFLCHMFTCPSYATALGCEQRAYLTDNEEEEEEEGLWNRVAVPLVDRYQTT